MIATFATLFRFATAMAVLLVASRSGTLQAQTWVPLTSGSEGDIWEIDFIDDQRGVAATWVVSGSSEVLETTDGATWSTPFTEANQGLVGAAYVAHNNAVVVGGNLNVARAYRSFNGSGWELVVDSPDPKPAFWSVAFSGQTGYAGGGAGAIWKTTDGGGGWSGMPARVSSGEVIDLYFLSPDTGFAITGVTDGDFLNGKTLYRTVDGGRRWTLVQQQFFVIRSVWFVDQSTGYLAGSNGQGPTVWKTTDGGTTWSTSFTTALGSSYMNDVEFATDNPYVGYAVAGNVFDGGAGMIVATTDGGATWAVERNAIPQALRTVDIPSQAAVYAAGDVGAIYKTTRTPIERPLPQVGISEDTVSFGIVAVGQTVTAQFRVRSETIVSLGVDGVEFDDPAAESKGFSLSFGKPLPAMIRGGDSVPVVVGFTPSAAGPVETVITIRTNDPDNPVMRVVARGEGEEEVVILPGASISEENFDFGEVYVGESKQMTLTIAPINEAGLRVEDVGFGGNDAEAQGFSISSGRTLPATLAQGEELEVVVRFRPTDAGVVSNDLRVTTNDDAQPEVTIPLEGIGIVQTDGVADYASVARNFHIAPNPARQFVVVSLSLERAVGVDVRMIDGNGKVVALLPGGDVEAGDHRWTFEVADIPPGVYFSEILVDGVAAARVKWIKQ